MNSLITGRDIEARVLRILAQGERYGFQITKELGPGALPGGEGALYPILHRLVKRGILKDVWKIDPLKNRRRRFYGVR